MNVISGRAGRWASPVRWGLSALSIGYEGAIVVRNRRFDRGVAEIVKLPVPVISVGNITTGGTGKTPLVIDFLRRLLRRGRRPAMLSRGYKSPPGQPGDESVMVAECVPEAVCVANPDRVAGGREAVARGADVIVLDDGFQHRRLARDLDVVVVDAGHPFGFGHVLPRGTLREPVDQLRRAGLIVISHVDHTSPEELNELNERLSAYAPDVAQVRCRHRPTGLTDLAGVSCHDRYQRALVFAAIGNPERFIPTVKLLGIEPTAHVWWPDHHRYTSRDIVALAATRSSAHDVVLTTHKDAVKLRNLNVAELEPLRVVRMELEFRDDGDGVLDAHVEAALGGEHP